MKNMKAVLTSLLAMILLGVMFCVVLCDKIETMGGWPCVDFGFLLLTLTFMVGVDILVGGFIYFVVFGENDHEKLYKEE